MIVELARRTLPLPFWQQLIQGFAVISEREERFIKILAAFEINAETLIDRKPGDPQAEDQTKGCDGEWSFFKQFIGIVVMILLFGDIRQKARLKMSHTDTGMPDF